jgi:hypothetical protein
MLGGDARRLLSRRPPLHPDANMVCEEGIDSGG